MKIENAPNEGVAQIMKNWSSTQMVEMRELGIVCADCPLCLLLLGHIDRVHCKRPRVRRTVKARKRCKYREAL